MTYNGDPIQAFFHSSSDGKTESSENVWMVDLPYLQSVKSPETGGQIPNFVSTARISYTDFTTIVTDAYPEAVFEDDVESWISNTTYTSSGRVAELVVGGVPIKSTELRRLFDLRSTAFTVDWSDGEIVFTVIGFGHGVGMSQYGAYGMAMDGKSYREILMAYYTGIEFAEVK